MSESTEITEEQRQAVQQYQRLREQVEEMYSKVGQLETDKSEHDLVIKSLVALEDERRCWHQVGVVLAEKKVKDVLPLLRINSDQVRFCAGKGRECGSVWEYEGVRVYEGRMEGD